MNQVVKVSIGLILLIAFSNVQAVLVSRLTVERDAGRFNEEETLVGKFKFRDGLTAGPITDEDIVSFKWLNGSMFGFDTKYWSYFYPPKLQAILSSDGSIALGDNGRLEIFSEPPLSLVISYVYLEIYAWLPYTEPEAVCFTDDYAFMRCDGGQEEAFPYVDITFTPVRKVPEPSFGLVIPFAVTAFMIASRRRVSSEF